MSKEFENYGCKEFALGFSLAISLKKHKNINLLFMCFELQQPKRHLVKSSYFIRFHKDCLLQIKFAFFTENSKYFIKSTNAIIKVIEKNLF